MKTGIITFHFANNFGAALQTYGLLQTVSELCGEEAEVIDYRNPFICFTDLVRLFPVTSNPKELLSGLSTFRKRLGRRKKFIRFQRKYFHSSGTWRSVQSLKKKPPVCDFYICGSDQIWNPVVTLGVDPAYYLDFVKDGGRKISYGASFGISGMKDRHCRQIRRYLEDFKALSVREKNGAELVEGLMGRKVTQVIDPTFLLDKEQWKALAVKPAVKGDYILVYVMQNNRKVYEYARRIKEALGLKLVVISRYGYRLDFMDEVMIDIGPREYLGLFAHASFVCTNSFHGLVYSVIFEKDFYVVPSTRFNSRIDNLMQVLGLKNYEELTREALAVPGYSREQVKQVIQKEREKAVRYLSENMLTAGDEDDR